MVAGNQGLKFGAVPIEPYVHLLDLTEQEAERQLAVALDSVSKIITNSGKG